MTETVVKDEGEFAKIIDKVRFSTANLRVDTATDKKYDVLFVVSAKDMIDAAQTDAPDEVKKTPWFMKWFKTK